jgi:coenzyme PQQ biosynthesis protein PqqD
MSDDGVIRRPVLAAHTRYRWDKLRDQHQLVFPEGMIVLNDSAAAIVQLCDGRTTDELIAALKEKFPGAEPDDDVHEFLGHLAQRGLVREGAPRD